MMLTWHEIMNVENLNLKLVLSNKLITGIFEKHISECKIFLKCKPSPWIMSGILQFREERDKACKLFGWTNQEADFVRYKILLESSLIRMSLCKVMVLSLYLVVINFRQFCGPVFTSLVLSLPQEPKYMRGCLLMD